MSQSPTKTQFYSANGAGRDSYIYGNNGGFCPSKQPCKIEDLGAFAIQKARPSHNLAMIHSKPVVYVNNGGGRDTYISNSSGGLRADYRPAHGARTFYRNLRQYDQVQQVNRGTSHMATASDKRDLLCNSQNKYNDKFRRNATLVKNYQNMLDARLAVPKVTEVVENGKVFRNSTHKIQKDHQERVYRSSVNSLGRVMEQEDMMQDGQSGYPTIDLMAASYSKMKKPRNTIDM